MKTVAHQVATIRESFWAASLGFNEDGSQLAVSGDFDARQVHVWSWRDGPRLLRTLPKSGPPGSYEPMCYSADGRFLAVAQGPGGAGDDVIVRVWNPHTGELVHDLVEREGGDNWALAFTPDSRFLLRVHTAIRGSLSNRLVVHRTDTWATVWGLHPTAETVRDADEPYSSIGRMAVSADGKFAALGTAVYEDLPSGQEIPHPMILVVDLAAQRVVKKIDDALPASNRVESIAWTPDGRYIAVGGRVGGSFPGPDAIRVFDAATGSQSASVHATESGAVYGLVFSPDGKYLIAGSIENTTRIFDAKNYELLQVLPDADKVAVSHDGRYLAIAPPSQASRDRDVSLWELR